MKNLYSFKGTPFLLVFPGLFVMAFAIGVPLCLSVYFSVTSWSGFGPMKIIGLENFKQILLADPTFWKSLLHALILAAVTLFIQNPLAFILAALLTQVQKGGRFFRTVYFIPAVLSVVVITKMWVHVFNPTYGILNKFLRMIGLMQFGSIAWLSNPATALGSVIFIVIWHGFGWALLFYYTGLMTVPKDLEEAARIDGASWIQLYTHVIIPYILPVMQSVAIIGIIACLKQMEVVYLSTEGGPGSITQFIANYLYIKAFKYSQYGYGNAISVLFFVIAMTLVLVTRRLTHREDLYGS
jgi:raffinose/stachyose/melibiose transport system permease protein